MSNLIISQSPHVHSPRTMEHDMRDVVIALVPTLAASLLFFGIGSLIVCATSVLACVATEWIIGKYVMHTQRSTITDWSAVITGLLLGFNLPSNIPAWIVVLGAIVAIGVGKMTFGGRMQHLQPSIGGPLLPARVVPLADDLMARGRTTAEIYRRRDWRHAT